MAESGIRKRIAVLGAGGIVGQTMMVREPDWADARYVRRSDETGLFEQVDLTDPAQLDFFLTSFDPEIVINLAGINQVDAVETDPEASYPVNVELVERLAKWSDSHGKLIQVSTQAVFDGEHPPYSPYQTPDPLNQYGAQKAMAESYVKVGLNWLIARLTLVLGVRPFPAVGRPNPLEHMLEAKSQQQVNDRLMSIVSSHDAADALWSLCLAPETKQIFHVGSTHAYSRYDIAKCVATHTGHAVAAISQDKFVDAAPRARNTKWSMGALKDKTLESVVVESMDTIMNEENVELEKRAMEIALFLEDINFHEAKERLRLGFHANHELVAQDFLQYGADVNNSQSLLDWYLDTEAYIWELSAYHLEPGFNYRGMCNGLVNHLLVREKYRVLCLGDGIGDLSLAAARAGLHPVYHDLEGSRTAEFAQFRFSINHPVEAHLTDSFHPALPSMNDAVIALDFFEHLPNVEDWVHAVYHSLHPGGLFLAQNAFGIGDAEHGNSIPMHLSVNNRFVKEWDQLLLDRGFEMTGEGTWWRKK